MSIPDITQAPSPVPAEWPEWFRKKREKEWQHFLDMPVPSRSSEEWRYGNIKPLNLNGIHVSSIFPTVLELDNSDKGIVLYFNNGHFVAATNNATEDVIILPLSSAFKEMPKLLEQYFMKENSALGSEKYLSLHASHVTDGAFIHIPTGVKLAHPVRIVHVLGGGNDAVFPHTLIVCEENAMVTVVEEFRGVGEGEPFVMGMSEVITGRGATIQYACLQNLSENSRCLQIHHNHLEKNASVTQLILNTGGAWVRQESISRLNGEEAMCRMLSASVASGTQEYDHRTFQDHAVPHTCSSLLYKNTLLDKAKTTFSGMISVEKGAHFTDAYQTCRNLILSDDAQANSLPGLEINADQVKCSHGTTNASLDGEQIFYLLSRGLSLEAARKLIARGFSVEVLEQFGCKSIETYAFELLEEKFDRIAD